MAKSLTEIRSLARSHTRGALNVLIAVMRNTKSPPAARIAAANAILDRGWGKPSQPIGGADDLPPIKSERDLTEAQLLAIAAGAVSG